MNSTGGSSCCHRSTTKSSPESGKAGRSRVLKCTENVCKSLAYVESTETSSTSLSRKRSSSLSTSASLTTTSFGAGRSKRHRAITCEDCRARDYELQMLRAENDSLKCQLDRALKELEGKRQRFCAQDTENSLKTAKIKILAMLDNGAIRKEDVLEGRVTGKVRGGIDPALFKLALCDIVKEVREEEKEKALAVTKDAREAHDDRVGETGVFDESFDVDDLLDEADRDLLDQVKALVENEGESEAGRLKKSYVAIRYTINKAHSNIMRCDRNSIRKLLKKSVEDEYNKAGAQASEVRDLLVARYLDEDPPHEDLDTDALDTGMENDSKVLVRVLAALHVLGLPGGFMAEISSAAKLLKTFINSIFGPYLSMDRILVMKDIKRIIDTRHDPKSTLIYLKQITSQVLDIL